MSLDEPLSDAKLIGVIENTLKRKGVDLNRYKITFLKRRLDIRMKIKGISDYSKYALLLNSDSQELTELLQSLSINVTNFFRDVQIFNTFSNTVIQSLISRTKQFDTIRIWSAGCATGEEPYSVAILFKEALENQKGPLVEITATDVSQKAINLAKIGLYSGLSIKELSPQLIAKYFHIIKDKDDKSLQYQVSENIKSRVNFKVDDILSNSIHSYDVIFCRNVLIYYTKDAHDLILKKFYNSLKNSGYLILGMDETMLGRKVERLFSPISIKERIYQRKE